MENVTAWDAFVYSVSATIGKAATEFFLVVLLVVAFVVGSTLHLAYLKLKNK